jgi:hypothetical protein
MKIRDEESFTILKLQTLIKVWRCLYNETYVFQVSVAEGFVSTDFIWEGYMRNKHSELWIENNFGISLERRENQE